MTARASIESNDIQLPPMIFNSSRLGNRYEAPTIETKRKLVQAWLNEEHSPIAIETSDKFGAGLSMEVLGDCFRKMNITPERVVIINSLGWHRSPLTSHDPTFQPGTWVAIKHDAERSISRQGMQQCWKQSCELLGDQYRRQLVAVADAEEYVTGAPTSDERKRRKGELLEALTELSNLKKQGKCLGVGLFVRDWNFALELSFDFQFDWFGLRNVLTIHNHSRELEEWLASLSESRMTIINSGIFNSGFLNGSNFYDGRRMSEDAELDQPFFRWRASFMSLCNKHAVHPTTACIQFSLSHPLISSVIIDAKDPARVSHYATSTRLHLPDEFWNEAKVSGIIRQDYPYVGSQ